MTERIPARARPATSSVTFIAAALSITSMSTARAATHTCAQDAPGCSVRIKDGWVSGGASSSTLQVSDTCGDPSVEVVSVTLDVAHSSVGDLKIRLRAPDGREALLLQDLGKDAQKGGCPSDNINATFEPGAAAPSCRSENPAIAGRVGAPALTALAGAPRNGNWMLILEDLLHDHVGVLKSWTLNLWCGLPRVSLEVLDGVAREGETDTARVVVRRTGDATAGLVVPLTWGGSAVAGTDYTAPPANVTLAPGESAAEITLTALQDNTPEGVETITAELGAGLFVASAERRAEVLIVGAATSTALTTSANPVAVETAVTFTATVTGMATAGVVEFLVNGNVSARVPTTAGVSTFSTSALPTGAHQVVAQFAGGVDAAPSRSPPLVQLVGVQTATTLTVSPNPAEEGQDVTLTAAVMDPRGVPAGTVVFRDGDVVLGTQQLLGGTATWVARGLAAGTHAITALHVEPTGTVVSTSAATDVVINAPTAAPTTTTLAVARASVGSGEPVQVLATVASASGTPAGVVEFREGTTVLAFSTLSQGAAAGVITGLGAGDHAITAAYVGTDRHAASVSSPVSVTVAAAPAPAEEDGCGCSASGERATGTPAALLLLGLASLTAARRRRIRAR